jgi:GH35 family endo-1,4-beta-xylanase
MMTRCNVSTSKIKLTIFLVITLLLSILNVEYPDALAQVNDHRKIEQKYLAKAKLDIERYRKGDVVIKVVGAKSAPLNNITVVINQVSQDFLFGNTGFDLARFGESDESKDDVFKEKFKALFNMAVLPFYWSDYESEQGKTKWQNNQEVIEWCVANGITTKGHTLGWTHIAGTPSWLLKQSYNTAYKLYEARILNTVGGYKGEIDIWDVVNEPVNTVPLDFVLRDTANSDGRIGEGMRYDISEFDVGQWLPWVEKSFRWAYQANPKATFILNEFNQIAVPAVRERFFQFVKSLQARNVPLTGIGMQAHEPREMWFSPVEFYATLEQYKQLNLPIHITEFIPQSSGKEITGNWRQGTWTAEAQAEFAVQFYTLAFAHPTIASINWWGLSDKNIWLKGGGLLDEDYNPKPVYNALLQLIKTDWMTKDLRTKTNKLGTVNFKGFYGKYEVVASKSNGSVQKFDLHVKENTANTFIITLEN